MWSRYQVSRILDNSEDGMANLIFHTDCGVAGLLLRITVAVVIFPHGAQKLFGWFGGDGAPGKLSFFMGPRGPVGGGVGGGFAEVAGAGALVLGAGGPGAGGPLPAVA